MTDTDMGTGKTPKKKTNAPQGTYMEVKKTK